jgi:hypothetical protein
MIKKGDKLLCLKTVEHYITGKIRFREGEFYKIIRKAGNNLDLMPEDGDDTCVVSLVKGDTYFSENFITMAQWRDLQIDSILND